MPWFEITLAIHLASISVWLVWSTYTGFEALRALRGDDDAGFVAFLHRVVRRGQAVYMPAALVALASGQISTALGPYEFRDPSSIAALVLLVMAIVLGASFVGPQTEILSRHVAVAGRDGLALTGFWRIFWIHHVKLAALYATMSLALVQLLG